MMSDKPYKIVIGLETHVQLLTETKLFCRCQNRFGGSPNTQTCPVCIGLPGTLPVMNRKAFQFSLITAIALNCEVPKFTKWDRKSYYYPDLPKGYQISQYDLPMSQNGWLEISDPQENFEPKRVGIIRAHLEEDAGKSMHDEFTGKADSRIDLNRTGTPLLEIVSCPEMYSSLEAKTYLTELKLLLTYLEVSDCNMQEGSLRVDANINLHVDTPQGRVATPIVEVKNMNSFRAVERALDYEAQRQYSEWQEAGKKLGDVPKQTRGWDDGAQVTRAQRSKEESSDYRYFPDPDLVPVIVEPEEVEQVRQSLGELPAVLRKRLQTDYSIKPYDANVTVNQGPKFAEYFIRLAETCGDPQQASNWMQQEVLRTLNEEAWTVDEFPVTSDELSQLLQAVQKGDIDRSRAREVFREMTIQGSTFQQAMQSLGIEQVDQSALLQLCELLLDEFPQIVADVKAGKQQALGRIIGEAKKRNPNVNPGQFRQLCLDLIEQK